MNIAKTRLRKYRLSASLSQRDVARALRLKSSTVVSRWERGERLPNPRRLLELSALYHRLVNDILRPDWIEARDRVNRELERHDIHPSLP
ncbi:MAG: helix-turn-helix transcriptional regulator [Candidatus Eisenbacteria bacterium]